MGSGSGQHLYKKKHAIWIRNTGKIQIGRSKSTSRKKMRMSSRMHPPRLWHVRLLWPAGAYFTFLFLDVLLPSHDGWLLRMGAGGDQREVAACPWGHLHRGSPVAQPSSNMCPHLHEGCGATASQYHLAEPTLHRCPLPGPRTQVVWSRCGLELVETAVVELGVAGLGVRAQDWKAPDGISEACSVGCFEWKRKGRGRTGKWGRCGRKENQREDLVVNSVSSDVGLEI
jgi:hypothetical protein